MDWYPERAGRWGRDRKEGRDRGTYMPGSPSALDSGISRVREKSWGVERSGLTFIPKLRVFLHPLSGSAAAMISVDVLPCHEVREKQRRAKDDAGGWNLKWGGNDDSRIS